MALRVAFDNAGDDVGEVGVRLDADKLAGFDQRGDHRPVLSATIRAGKQGVLAIQGQHPFILPMSGMKRRSIIAGILVSAEGY